MSDNNKTTNAKYNEQERWRIAKLLRQELRELSRQLNQKNTR